ncbi:MAG TPA: glycoside hydrolase family 3 N-terminal domain-containing protein, partial [Ilumatobacteraceae bacterium]
MSASSDRRLVAGCLLGSFIGTEAPDWVLRSIADGLGGVLLFAQNIVDDAQVSRLCGQLRGARPDVVIAIDEEGGDVTRLDAVTGSETPSPAAFGYVDDVRSTTDSYRRLGYRIANLGIDLVLAPCADINSNPLNPIIGVRSFGTTGDLVARHVAAAIDGFHEAGLTACAKHFPGHGDTSADTHRGPARVDASRAVLTQRELVPFAAAVGAGVDAILTAHIIAEAFDREPASLSTAWTAHLRQEMDFDGVIITDALDMDAVAHGRGIAGVADAAVRALDAGADFLCLGSNFDESMTDTVIDQVVAAVVDGRLNPGQLQNSVERISTLCGAHAIVADTTRLDDDPVAERAIAVDGSMPTGSYAVLECRPPGSQACWNVSWGIAGMLGERGWPVATMCESDAVEPACAAFLETAGTLPILVVVRDALVHKWQTRVVDLLTDVR